MASCFVQIASSQAARPDAEEARRILTPVETGLVRG